MFARARLFLRSRCCLRSALPAFLALLFTAPFMSPAPALAVEIKVIASVAPKDAYLELLPQFERASGHKVVTEWAPTVEMLRRLKEGEGFDLVLISTANMDELSRLGVIAPGARWDVASSGIGVAIKAGAPRPDISSVDKLKETLLAARSVAYSTGPSGVYLVGLFERMGLTAALAPKIKAIQGVPVAVLVARGEYEIGFQQVPEILPVPGIDYLGPLPPGAQSMTMFPMGVHAKADAAHAQAARAWVEFLRRPESAEVFRKHGLVPAGQ
jgi:molybdate transport system substrate-binding protein